LVDETNRRRLQFREIFAKDRCFIFDFFPNGDVFDKSSS